MFNIYKALFLKLLLPKALNSFLRSQRTTSETFERNKSYYKSKLEHVIDPACEELKLEYPWINAFFLAVLMSLIPVFIALNYTQLSVEFFLFGYMLVLILFAAIVLSKATKKMTSISDISGGQQLHHIVSMQVPLALIQLLIAATMLFSVKLLGYSSFFVAATSLALCAFTQFNMMMFLIRTFESKKLQLAEVTDFINAASESYSLEVRGEIFSRIMDGSDYTLYTLRILQGKPRVS